MNSNSCCVAERPAAQEESRVERTRSACCYRPHVDILEGRDELIVMADLPGVGAKDINIDFEQGVLTVHGKVRPRTGSQAAPLLQEYGVGDFYRTFKVGQSIDSANIKAKLEDGVLTLALPKTASARSRKIAVQCSC